MAELFDFTSMPRLETTRLVVRETDPVGDLPALSDLFADPAVARFTDTGQFMTFEEAEEVMSWIGDITSKVSSRRRWGRRPVRLKRRCGTISAARHPPGRLGTGDQSGG